MLRSDAAADFGLSLRSTDGSRQAALAWEPLAAAARWLEAELAAGRTPLQDSPRVPPTLARQREAFAGLRAAFLRSRQAYMCRPPFTERLVPVM
jgi:hypothetical protein